MVKRPQEGFKDEKDVQYEPRRVPRYSDYDLNIDGEDMTYNFKAGKTVHEPQEPMTELHS